MFAHSNFKRCMVISGVIILAHAALSRMGLLAHRSPRAQQPWQMPTSLCDGLKGGVLMNCQPPVHSAPHPPPHPPIRSPVGPVGTPARQSGRPLAISPAARQSPSSAACLLAGPSVQPFASPAARQPASPTGTRARKSCRPSVRPPTNLSDPPSVRRSCRPSVLPSNRPPTRYLAHLAANLPAHPLI